MEQKHFGLHTFPFWYDCVQHEYQNDSCDITKLLTPDPLVTICHKSGEPLPPLGCDVIYGRSQSLFVLIQDLRILRASALAYMSFVKLFPEIGTLT